MLLTSILPPFLIILPDYKCIFCVCLCSMVSCGLGNVRLWRVRGGSLRSCPVDLGQYHNLEFTDLGFEQGHTQDRPVDDRTL